MCWRWPGYGLGIHKILHSYSYETDICTDITFITSREVIDMVGLYEEAYAPAYYEDASWALRSRKFGVQHFVCPYAKVLHRHNESFSAIYKKKEISDICRRNRKYLIRKHYSGLDKLIRLLTLNFLDLFKIIYDSIMERTAK